MKPTLADAHIHLFEGGYRRSFTGRSGVQIAEAACYDSLACDHGIAAALVVAYAAEPWAAANNAYIARLAARYAWVKPLAFIHSQSPPSLSDLERWRSHGFMGVSIYMTDPAQPGASVELPSIPAEAWSWIESNRWLVSVNARGAGWAAWTPVLREHPGLRVLCSHLGLPPRCARPPEPATAKAALQEVLDLARFQDVRVKLSGFYALTDPGHDYPHAAAWPYVAVLREAFGVDRLLWASDFSPCLGCVSFAQTLGVIGLLPGLSDADRRKMMGDNLLGLIEEVVQ